MIEREIDYYYFEETDSLDELDVVILHDENGEHEDIEYVRKDKAPGDTSDGFHTFDELYDHRTGLLMAFCNLVVIAHTTSEMRTGKSTDIPLREVVFKSRMHHDGTMYDGFFIVGIACLDDPDGTERWATWHCEDKWWGRFMCPELERAPEWDGHTPKDALDRLVDAFAPAPVSDEWIDDLLREFSGEGAGDDD